MHERDVEADLQVRVRKELPMLMFLVILLVALWLLGMITSTMLGGWLHILLVVAIVFLLIRVIRGEPV
jgi:fatty acid desaturase